MATSLADTQVREPRWPAVLAWTVAGVTMLSLIPGQWLLSRTWLAAWKGWSRRWSARSFPSPSSW